MTDTKLFLMFALFIKECRLGCWRVFISDLPLSEMAVSILTQHEATTVASPYTTAGRTDTKLFAIMKSFIWMDNEHHSNHRMWSRLFTLLHFRPTGDGRFRPDAIWSDHRCSCRKTQRRWTWTPSIRWNIELTRQDGGLHLFSMWCSRVDKIADSKFNHSTALYNRPSEFESSAEHCLSN